MVRLQAKAHDKGYFVTIPQSLVKQKEWQAGQDLDLRFNERGNVEIFEIK